MIIGEIKKFLVGNSKNFNSNEFILFLKRVFRFPIYYFKGMAFYLKNKMLKIPNIPVVKRLQNNLNFAFDFYYDPRVHRIYRELYEPQTIRILRKYLKKGDTFLDVGANIGYISIIGAGIVGKQGEVHSFEPVPKYFQYLKFSSQLNKDYKIIPNQCAIGNSKGTAPLKLTIFKHIGYNTMVEKFVREENLKEIIKVNVERLDDYIFKNKLTKISVIKIDVEGFENFVLSGLRKFFEKEKNLPVIICELMPSYNIKDLLKFMIQYGYRAYDMIFEKPIDIREVTDLCDVLFKPSRKLIGK